MSKPTRTRVIEVTPTTHVEVVRPGRAKREEAKVKLFSFGLVDELRCKGAGLNAVAKMQNLEIGRILEVMKVAETEREFCDDRTVECLEYLVKRLSSLDPKTNQLSFFVEMEMVIGAARSIKLVPDPTAPILD